MKGAGVDSREDQTSREIIESGEDLIVMLAPKGSCQDR